METEEVQVSTASCGPSPAFAAVPVPTRTRGISSPPRARRRPWPRWRVVLASGAGSLLLVAAVVASVLNHDTLQRTDASIAEMHPQSQRTAAGSPAPGHGWPKPGRKPVAAASRVCRMSGKVQAELASTQSDINVDGVNIANLDACLSGVNQALNEISLGDQSGATVLIDQYAGACQAASRPDDGRPATGSPCRRPAEPRFRGPTHIDRRLVATAFAALIVAAAAYNIVAISDQHRAEATQHATHLGLTKERATLSSIEGAVGSTDGARDARRQAEARTNAEIGATETSLRSAAATGSLQSLDIATLRACLAGVSGRPARSMPPTFLAPSMPSTPPHRYASHWTGRADRPIPSTFPTLRSSRSGASTTASPRTPWQETCRSSSPPISVIGRRSEMPSPTWPCGRNRTTSGPRG